MRRTRIFATKGGGLVLVALLLAAMGNVASYADTSETVQQTIRIPGEVPAFFVGPIDDGDPATDDLYYEADGVKNLALTLSATRASDLVTSATIGAVTNCAADARVNTLLKVTVGGSSAAKADLFVEYDKPSSDALSDSHVWIDSEGKESLEKTPFASAQATSPHSSRTMQIPICIR